MILSKKQVIETIELFNAKGIDIQTDVMTLKHMDYEDMSHTQGFCIDGPALVELSSNDKGEYTGVFFRSLEQASYDVGYYIHWDELALCQEDLKLLLPITDYVNSCKFNAVREITTCS